MANIKETFVQLDKSLIVTLSKVAEQSERYEDMVTFMEFVAQNHELSTEERNLLSVAFKNVIGARRSSWRILSNIEAKSAESDHIPSHHKEMTIEYKKQVEEELSDICNRVLGLLENHLIPNSTKNSNLESTVFYHKMMGDYYRYLAEVLSTSNKEVIEKSEKAYEKASEEAKEMESTHPIRLGLALNYSVFHYEIKSNPEKACELAQGACDEAITMLDTLDTESYKDGSLILQLLRDNLTLWRSSCDQEGFENN